MREVNGKQFRILSIIIIYVLPIVLVISSAILAFVSLGNYKDSKNKLTSLEASYNALLDDYNTDLDTLLDNYSKERLLALYGDVSLSALMSATWDYDIAFGGDITLNSTNGAGFIENVENSSQHLYKKLVIPVTENTLTIKISEKSIASQSAIPYNILVLGNADRRQGVTLKDSTGLIDNNRLFYATTINSTSLEENSGVTTITESVTANETTFTRIQKEYSENYERSIEYVFDFTTTTSYTIQLPLLSTTQILEMIYSDSTEIAKLKGTELSKYLFDAVEFRFANEETLTADTIIYDSDLETSIKTLSSGTTISVLEETASYKKICYKDSETYFISYIRK